MAFTNSAILLSRSSFSLTSLSSSVSPDRCLGSVSSECLCGVPKRPVPLLLAAAVGETAGMGGAGLAPGGDTGSRLVVEVHLWGSEVVELILSTSGGWRSWS